MAHPEMQLISRIVRFGELNKVLEWGITEDDFQTTEAKGWFKFLKGVHSSPESRGAVPGLHAMRAHYPSFDLCDDESMTLDALCVNVRKFRLEKEAEALLRKTSEMLALDPIKAVAQLAARAQALNSLGLKVQDEFYEKAIDDLVDRYEKMEEGIGLSGLTWPWPPFQNATAGIQDDDYIVLYGRPKSMKSFVLAKMAAHSYEEGKHVMIYTKEMPAWQIFRRVTACIARLPYDELRLGRLRPDQKRSLLLLRSEIQQQAKVTNRRHAITALSGRDAPAGTDSISWLRGKILKHKPDIVYIDGLYLMSAEGKVAKDHERVAQISRAARQMVLDLGIPIVATMQANRAAAKHDKAELDEIAFSDAIGQDATCAIRVINEKHSPTLALVVAGSREFNLHAVRIHGIPCSDFSFKEEMTEKDVRKAERDDAADYEAERVVAPTRKPRPLTKKASKKTPMGATLTDRIQEIC